MQPVWQRFVGSNDILVTLPGNALHRWAEHDSFRGMVKTLNTYICI